jgi:hypothetical protein
VFFGTVINTNIRTYEIFLTRAAFGMSSSSYKAALSIYQLVLPPNELPLEHHVRPQELLVPLLLLFQLPLGPAAAVAVVDLSLRRAPGGGGGLGVGHGDHASRTHVAVAKCVVVLHAPVIVALFILEEQGVKAVVPGGVGGRDGRCR